MAPIWHHCSRLGCVVMSASVPPSQTGLPSLSVMVELLSRCGTGLPCRGLIDDGASHAGCRRSSPESAVMSGVYCKYCSTSVSAWAVPLHCLDVSLTSAVLDHGTQLGSPVVGLQCWTDGHLAQSWQYECCSPASTCSLILSAEQLVGIPCNGISPPGLFCATASVRLIIFMLQALKVANAVTCDTSYCRQHLPASKPAILCLFVACISDSRCPIQRSQRCCLG